MHVTGLVLFSSLCLLATALCVVKGELYTDYIIIYITVGANILYSSTIIIAFMKVPCMYINTVLDVVFFKWLYYTYQEHHHVLNLHHHSMAVLVEHNINY